MCREYVGLQEPLHRLSAGIQAAPAVPPASAVAADLFLSTVLLFSCLKVLSLHWMLIKISKPTFKKKQNWGFSFSNVTELFTDCSSAGRQRPSVLTWGVFQLSLQLLVQCVLWASQKDPEPSSVPQNLRCLFNCKLSWLLFSHYGLQGDNQCTLYLIWRSLLRCRNQASYRKNCQAHGSILSWAERRPFAGHRSGAICLMYWRSHFPQRQRRWHVIDDFMPEHTRLPSPFFSCLCPKSKSSLVKWQRYTCRKSGLSEMVSVMSGQYVRKRETEGRKARDNLFGSSILCRSLDQLQKGDGHKVWPNTTMIWSIPASVTIWRWCRRYTWDCSVLCTLSPRLN